MSGALALFGFYPMLPASIRMAGNQPSFNGGHCIYVSNVGGYVPPFLNEWSGETGAIADCVPASCVRGVNFQTHGAQAPCTPTEREALQNAMGTQDVGANELQAANGIQARYGFPVQYGQSWTAIVTAIGSEAAAVRVGDPLANADNLSATLADLKPYSAGLSFRYVAFSDASLPDTATSDPTMTFAEVHLNNNPKRQISFAAGKAVPIYAVLTPGAPQSLYQPTTASSASSDRLAQVNQTPSAAPSGWYVHIVDGIYADKWVPLSAVTLAADSAPVANCATQIAAAVAPFNARLTEANTRLSAISQNAKPV